MIRHNIQCLLLLFGGLLLIMMLGGCAHNVDGPTSLKPICDVLGTPIRVNVKNPKSPWHAGPSLAKRVYQQDDKGAYLSCPGY